MSCLIRYCCLIFISGIVFAAPPTSDGIFPCGGKAGSTGQASLSGKASPWPPQIWCSNPKVKIVPGEKTPSVTIEIDAKAKPGPCLIRVWNKEGTSEPIPFLIGPASENKIIEDEKQANRSIAEAQPVGNGFPCTICGRLNPTKDIDCYQIPLKKGQTLYAFMEGYTFRGGIDSILHLYHPDGHRVHLAQDNTITPDPELIHKAQQTGNYTLAVMAFATPPTANIHFHGSTKSSYQINLALKKSDIPSRLHLSKGRPDADISKPLTPPFNLFQTLTAESPRHNIRITSKTKQTWKIEIKSYQHRYPTDPVLKLKNKDGKTIREVDDAKGKNRNAEYLWKTSTDGNYTLQIYDRYGKTGSDYRYQLTLDNPKPVFSSTVEKSNYIIEPGKEATIKVKLNRVDGHKAPLKLEIKNLPEGLSFDPPKIPGKTGDITIKLKATPKPKAFSGPIEITLTEIEGDSPAGKKSLFTFQDKNARGSYLIDDTPDIWLTVKEAKKPATPKPKK